MSEDPTDLVTKDGEPIVKGRIRPALDTAIRLIEEEGYTIADAALTVGYRTHSLVQALRKPHVRAHRAHVKHAWRESVTSASWVEMGKLALKAVSEDVRHKSAKFIIEKAEEAAGRVPEQARQIVQIINHGPLSVGQLPSQQSSGVIEAQPYQPLVRIPSNSSPVGRVEIEGDDDES